jgi:hypothetical protein
MRLSRTTWLVLGIAIFAIGAIVLYMFYQNQAEKRQEARDELGLVQDTVPFLFDQRGAAEAELADKENELAQWEDTINQLEEQVARLEITLSQTQEGFPVSAESIEYDEKLFSFALDHDVGLTLVTASELGSESIEDINYETVLFGIEIKGEVADILAFINTIVSDDDFRTAAIEPVNITIPEPLNDEQQERLEEGLRTQLTDEALAGITTDEIVGFTLKAIDAVVGDEFINQLTGGTDGQLDARSIAEMAATIKERIAGSIYLEQEYEEPLANDLAEFIAQQIADSVVGVVVAEAATYIFELVMPGEVVEGEGVGEDGEVEVVQTEYDKTALVELLGEDMATLLGPSIAGSTQGEIASILNKYIAGLIESKMLNSVADSVEEEIEATLTGMIEEMEMPSAGITIIIYLYQGEGE